MKEFLIQDGEAFKLRGKMWPCLSPNDLFCIEFVGEQYNEKQEKINESTYQFFLNKEHVQNMCKGLQA